MPGDNWMTLEIVNEGGMGKLRGSIALCSMTGGNAATGASEKDTATCFCCCSVSLRSCWSSFS